MKVKSEKAQQCACEVDLLKDVDSIVKEGKKPTRAQHQKRKSDVEAAFQKKTEKK